MKKILLLLTLIITFCLEGFSQNNAIRLNINIAAPYSTNILDYAPSKNNQMGKLLLTAQNTGRIEQKFYLRGEIKGLNNGVRIFTDANYVPAASITLAPLETRQLFVQDILDLFDPNHLTYLGTDQGTIKATGYVPEGQYSVCVRAFDHTAGKTNMPLSPENPAGCTTIYMRNIEPPMLILPRDAEEIKAMDIQNTVFSWTVPAGTPPGSSYLLKIVEIFDAKRNPTDAFISSTSPSFFEKEVINPLYVYGPADPPLVPGRKYAWAVTVKDPNGKSYYQNNGRSAVRSFIYGQPNNPPAILTKIPTPNPLFSIDPELVLQNLQTKVTGKLVYAYPEDYSLVNQGEVKIINPSLFSNINQKREGAKISDYYYDSPRYLKPSTNAKPLKNVKISLVMVYATTGKIEQGGSTGIGTLATGSIWNFISSINGSSVSFFAGNNEVKPKDIVKTLASTYTNENGEFNLNFLMKDTSAIVSFKTQKQSGEFGVNTSGWAKRTCLLIIESPYYCSPLMMINARPGDNINLPDLVSLVQSQELSIQVKNNEESGQMGGKGGSLQNINVELIRLKPIDSSLPEFEGQNLPPSSIQSLQMGDYSKVYPISKVGRAVAIGKTDVNGVFNIPRVIRMDAVKKEAFLAHSYSDKNVGTYNKTDALNILDSKTLPEGIIIKAPEGAIMYDFIFNNMYVYKSTKVESIMKSKPPIIKGKAVEKNKGLPGVVVSLWKNTAAPNATKPAWVGFGTQWTDTDGYFEFKDLPVGDYRMDFYKTGYKKVTYNGNLEYNQDLSWADKKAFSLMNGQLLQINEVLMQPKGTVFACVIDEDGNGVVADIQVGEGAFYKTNEVSLFSSSTACASFPASAGQNKVIKIFPRATDTYFDAEYKYDIKEDGFTNIPAKFLVVLRKKHRITVKVNGYQGNNLIPLAGATVSIKEFTAITDAKGNATLSFESPGFNFLLKVKPPVQDNYTHWEGKVEIPITKTPIEKVINLIAARTILATVNEIKHNKPSPSIGAKVYIKSLNSGWGTNTTNYTECITGADGTCMLKGIPTDEENIEIFAVKDSKTETYIGDKKSPIFLKGATQGTVSLNLKINSDFNVKDIWGFPVTIETVKLENASTYTVSGTIQEIPENPNFSSNGARLDFKDIKFIKETAGANSHQPQNGTLSFIQNTIPVKIGGKLQGVLSATSAYGRKQALIFPKLAIKKIPNNKGEIRGAVELELSSFQGAYQLEGKIELGENLDPAQILIFSSEKLLARKLNIGKSTSGKTLANLAYKVHNFNAEADATKSFLSGDSVNLYTILHTDIKEMIPADLAIHAGNITILQDKIIPFTGGEDISFSLEQWKLTGQKPPSGQVWKYDKNNGGIMIQKAVINTGIIAVSLKNLVIKPDRIIADKLDLGNEDAAAFSLGGITPLEITKGTEALFTYDPNCYHDNKPHWKLSLIAKTGEVAARVSHLDGFKPQEKLEFGSINLFSDSRQQLSGPSAKTFTLFNVLKFSLNTIDVGNNFFTLVGQASMDIPNMLSAGGGLVGQIIYAKDSKGKVKADIKPLFFEIEGKGQTTFFADDSPKSQVLSEGLFTSQGKLKIYDTPSGKWFFIDAFLKHQKTGTGYTTFVEVIENQKIPLGEKYLEVKPRLPDSGMKVEKGDWNNLVLKSVLPTKDSGFPAMLPEESERTLAFVVKGSLETDPSKSKVGIVGMSTGYDKLNLYYDFDRHEVRGDYTFVPPVPVPMGLLLLTSSAGAMMVGSGGFYSRSSATGQLSLSNVPLPAELKVNTLMGYYTKNIYPEDLKALTALAVQKSYPDQLNSGIKGMYFSFVQEITKEISAGSTTPAYSVGFKASADLSLEFRSFLNFKTFKEFYLEVGVFGYAHAIIGAEAVVLGVGGKGELGLNAQLALKASATPEVGLSYSKIKSSMETIKLEGCASLTGKLSIEGCVPIYGCSTILDLEKSLSIRAEISTKPDFSISFDDCGNAKPMETLPLN